MAKRKEGSMSLTFFDTVRGHRFFDSSLPRLIESIENLNKKSYKIVRGFRCSKFFEDEVYFNLEQIRKFQNSFEKITYQTVYVIVDQNGLTDATFKIFYETYDEAAAALEAVS